jgi:hypothetical protein
LEDLGIDERVKLKLTLKEQGGRVWTGFISCEHYRTPGFNKNYEHFLIS